MEHERLRAVLPQLDRDRVFRLIFLDESDAPERRIEDAPELLLRVAAVHLDHEQLCLEHRVLHRLPAAEHALDLVMRITPAPHAQEVPHDAEHHEKKHPQPDRDRQRAALVPENREPDQRQDHADAVEAEKDPPFGNAHPLKTVVDVLVIGVENREPAQRPPHQRERSVQNRQPEPDDGDQQGRSDRALV